MKKISIFTLLMLVNLIALGQPQNYVFTVSSGVAYQNLPSSTTITTVDWDDFTANVPLGFKFHFLGDSTGSFYFDENDMNTGTDMQFKTTTISANPFNVITTLIDLQDRHLNDATQFSKVGYQTEIVSGKKITKIEWRNCGIYDDTTTLDSLNMQCWVYEDNDALEFRFGNSSRKDITGIMNDPNIYGFKGPFIGFMKGVNPTTFTSDWIYYVSNLSPATMDSTDINTIINNPSLVGVDSFPNSNTLLRWSKAIPSGLNSVQLNDNISVYPTICQNEININFKNDYGYKLSIIGMDGSTLLSKNMGNKEEKLNTTNLASGHYFLVFTNENQKIVYRILKQ